MGRANRPPSPGTCEEPMREELIQRGESEIERIERLRGYL